MQAAPAAAETVNGDRVYVIDGDTVAVQGKRQRIRLLDIDAPETYQPRCERERLLGLKAKARLVDLLRGRKVVIERRGIDTYGRALAHLKVNGKDIGRVLLREGHAVAWRPGRKAWDDRRRHWCGGR
jgi:Micrococcal nuclease (thermonuclease) homologs